MEKGSDEYNRLVNLIVSRRFQDEGHACKSVHGSDACWSEGVADGVFCGTKISPVDKPAPVTFGKNEDVN